MEEMTSSHTAVVTLPTERQIVITREFDAPRHLVYRAYTTPELIERWWAGERGTVTSVQVDLRVGGSWRYVMMANDGFEVAFHGEFREIVTDERIVSTEMFEMPGADDSQAPLVTTTFVEHDGRTTFTQIVDCPDEHVRDMIVESGMEAGMQEGMDLLEQVALALA
jgi:uncharacterized protein YndB with AHSA1/START domain